MGPTCHPVTYLFFVPYTSSAKSHSEGSCVRDRSVGLGWRGRLSSGREGRVGSMGRSRWDEGLVGDGLRGAEDFRAK